MKIGKTEIDDKSIVKEKAKKLTGKQAEALAKDFNGMAEDKKRANKQIRDYVNNK